MDAELRKPAKINPSGNRGKLAPRGYRSPALAEPHRYRLLFGPPLPGYDAHAEEFVAASEAAMNLGPRAVAGRGAARPRR